MEDTSQHTAHKGGCYHQIDGQGPGVGGCYHHIDGQGLGGYWVRSRLYREGNWQGVKLDLGGWGHHTAAKARCVLQYLQHRGRQGIEGALQDKERHGSVLV